MAPAVPLSDVVLLLYRRYSADIEALARFSFIADQWEASALEGFEDAFRRERARKRLARIRARRDNQLVCEITSRPAEDM